jgi:hypothetical protein
MDMLREGALAEKSVVPSTAFLGEDRPANTEEIIRVLARAARDNSFIALLTYQGEEALQGYGLTWREKAALLSGDIGWIEAHVGKLNAWLRTWLDCRLQQEIW